MSQKREIELVIDEAIMEQIASKLGYKIRHNGKVYGYSTQHITAKLVVDIGRFSVGFNDGKIIYDDMIDNDKLVNLMENYIIMKMESAGHVLEKVLDNKKEVVYRVWR